MMARTLHLRMVGWSSGHLIPILAVVSSQMQLPLVLSVFILGCISLKGEGGNTGKEGR